MKHNVLLLTEYHELELNFVLSYLNSVPRKKTPRQLIFWIGERLFRGLKLQV